MTQMEIVESCRFHFRLGWFNFREQFTDIVASLAANALLPFYIWILSQIWERFNSKQGNFHLGEIVIYIGISEVLYLTFIRSNIITRASEDFSIAMARPRSWMMSSMSSIIGKSVGARIFMSVGVLCTFPFLGSNLQDGILAIMRLLLLLPWLAVIQGLFALFFAIAQVVWHQTNYFILPFGKILLVLGGVWGPIVDFNEPWKSIVLLLPPSDLFFQPAYFCIKGNFYEMSSSAWLIRTATLAAILSLINIVFYRWAKVRHQSFGG